MTIHARRSRTRSSVLAGPAVLMCAASAGETVTALIEMLGNGSRTWPYLPKGYDFRDGKMWPTDRPGLGVEVDVSKLTKIGGFAICRAGMPLNVRLDGSFTNW